MALAKNGGRGQEATLHGPANGHPVRAAKKDGPTLLAVSGTGLYMYMVSLPAFAMVSCILISLIFNFKGSVATACRVRNYLPSISAAIGGYTPQRYIWRICIALHIAPRLIVSVIYYNYYTGFRSASGGLAKLMAAMASLVHLLENMSLVTLSYVSSTENYEIHEGSFYFFIAFSQIYMIITVILFKTVHRGQWTEKSAKSYRYKVRLWLFNVASLIAAGYFFFRHNTYCEPGMYTIFALCEYSVVLSNIAFHASAGLDFGKGALKFVNSEEEKKEE